MPTPDFTVSNSIELAAAIAAAAPGSVIFLNPGTYVGEIDLHKALTFTSGNANTDPAAWAPGSEVVIDRISTDATLLVEGIHVHATHVGAGFVNGGTWEAIGFVGDNTETLTVRNSQLSIDGGNAPDAVQGFGLNITYNTGDIVVDHVHIGPFVGGFADPGISNYGMWINGSLDTSRDITVTDNVFETGTPRAVAVAFDGQIGGPQLDVSGNDFENPGTAPGAIRVFDFGDSLSGTQDYSGVTGNHVVGGGPSLSDETGGNDTIHFGGADDVTGTPGNDIFVADGGNDHIDGLSGIDTIDMSQAGLGGSVVDLDIGAGGVAVSVATGLDTLASIENVKGSAGADYIAGDAMDNDLSGAGGNDNIQGRGGNDHIDGGAGADAMYGGDGDDTYVVDNAGDTTVEGSGAGSGIDTVLSSVTYTLAANVENLTLTDAGSSTQNFENFAAGAITDGENGWKTAGAHDQEVTILSGGNHVFRMSSDPASGDFGGPYSPDIGASAGETTTTADGNVHVLAFVVKPVSETADSSRLEVDFGNASGTDRNNFMVIENYAGGLRIAVTEPDANGDFVATGSAPNDYRTIIDHLSTTEFHQIELRLTYVDGPNNDVIEIFVDGAKVGQTSTFENYHDTFGSHDALAEANQTNRIFFRASANGSPQDGAGVGQNQGFYFDDVTNTITRHIDGTGNELNNVITGNSGDNVLTGLGGDDTINGGGGTDTAVYTVDLTAADVVFDATHNTWIVHAGADGVDTLSDIEIIDDTVGGRILLVGGDGYPTIQAAIDAAADGDTIIVAPGTYDETVTVNKDVTLLGANYDHAGSGVRGDESNITGGVHFTAGGAHATLNGFEISGASDFGAGLDRPAGVLISADGVAVTNNLLTGSAADTRPFDANNGASDFSVDHNLVTGWSEGAYIVNGTSGTISDNVFEHNGNGVVSESTHVEITANTFSDSDGSHIAPLPYEDTSIATFVHDNIFLDQARPISVYLNGAATEVTGSDVAETIHGEYVTGPVTLNGGGGDDALIGGANDDTLDGGAGSDEIDGGGGADTVQGYDSGYHVARSGGEWVVTNGVDTDSLTNVERAVINGQTIWLVDTAAELTYALANASDGDTVQLAPGSYAGTFTVNDKQLTILGANHGVDGNGTRGTESSIAGHLVINGSHAVDVDGVEFFADGTTGTTGHGNAAVQLHGSGTYTIENSLFFSDFVGGNVEATGIMIDTTVSGHVVIDDNYFTGSKLSGFSGASWQRGVWSDGSSPDLDITGNTFQWVRSGINLDGYDDAKVDVSGNTFPTSGSNVTVGTGISIGLPAAGTTYASIHDNNFSGADSDLNLRNVTSDVTIDYSGTHNTTTTSAEILGGTGDDHITGTDGVDIIAGDGLKPGETGGAAGTYGAAGLGDDTIHGLGGNDFIYGQSGNDTIDGGSGDDTIDAGDGDDSVTGGDGSDTLEGGAGTDTAVFEHSINEYTFALGPNATYAVTRGADTDFVHGFENFSFAGGVTVDIIGNPGGLFNTHSPVFSSGTTASVDENVAPTTVVYDADATDADSTFGAITYTLGGADAGLLNIDAATGEVRLNSSPNFEAKASYAFDVVATQGSTATTQSVTLGINDLNDTNPVFSSGGTANVNENVAPTTVVYDANATDADSSATFGNIVYSLGGADAGLLNIDAATGEVRLNSSPDFEFKSNFIFNVVATQGITSATQGVTLSINDVNDDVLGGKLGQTVEIEAGSTQAPLKLTALTDPQNDPLSYTFNSLPGQGTLFLANGVAVVNHQVLSQAQFLGLTFSSPETKAPGLGFQFLVTDGHGTNAALNVTIAVAGPANSYFSGSAGNDRIDGAGGNDIIDGRGGADRMLGGSGNDKFVVENTGDRVVETLNHGTDTVLSFISHTLAANVERLVLVGTAYAGLGNELANVIVGNESNNLLYGFGGGDLLVGRGGNDVLRGYSGNDKLDGGAGNDLLTGGTGRDVFVFNTALNAATNRDVVTDFSHTDDTFHLDNAIFTKLGAAGALNADFFHEGSAAADANDYIVYNHSTGALIYDSNGSGAGGAIQFALITNKPTLNSHDFMVI